MGGSASHGNSRIGGRGSHLADEPERAQALERLDLIAGYGGPGVCRQGGLKIVCAVSAAQSVLTVQWNIAGPGETRWGRRRAVLLAGGALGIVLGGGSMRQADDCHGEIEAGLIDQPAA